MTATEGNISANGGIQRTMMAKVGVFQLGEEVHGSHGWISKARQVASACLEYRRTVKACRYERSGKEMKWNREEVVRSEA